MMVTQNCSCPSVDAYMESCNNQKKKVYLVFSDTESVFGQSTASTSHITCVDTFKAFAGNGRKAVYATES